MWSVRGIGVADSEKTEDDTYETTIDVKMDAYIPPKYIGNEIQKLAIYKRIASIENLEEYQDMQDELTEIGRAHV